MTKGVNSSSSSTKPWSELTFMEKGMESVLRCQIQEWWPIYGAKWTGDRGNLHKTSFVKLSKHEVDTLLRRLQDDEFVMDFTPKYSEQQQKEIERSIRRRNSDPYDDDSESDGEWLDRLGGGDDSSDEEDKRKRVVFYEQFPELHQRINNAIAEVGGSCFPKLNWSAPRDATWISAEGNLRCETPEDIFQILRASDFVTHDLDEPFAGVEGDIPSSTPTLNIDYSIAIQPWTPPSHAGRELRLFIRDNNLIGVCQRDVTTFYEFLGGEISQLIELAESSSMKDPETGKWFAKFSVPDFCADISIEETRRQELKVRLIGFNPWNECTDALLFDWDELEKRSGSPFDHNGSDINNDQVVERDVDHQNTSPSVASACTTAESSGFADRVRWVKSQSDCRADVKRYNSVPKDLLEYMHNPEEMLKVIQRVQKTQQKDDDDGTTDTITL